ncbi:hypothetical protein DNTS_014128 [Danionella cerebrum]|uniref:CD99 antigen-like protein 2 n=1 Tax=Danionella cerebrum TaxID=2873325 RepID=A0A553QMJ8_9TELE|nr:hypothetical protein DNTS_014128 [Danionella translucida]
MGKNAWSWTLLAVFSLLIAEGISQDMGLDLSDALEDDKPATKQPKLEPTGGVAKPSVKPTIKEPAKPKPKQTAETYTDFFDATIRPGLLPRTTTKPLQTAVAPQQTQSGVDDFDLSDALNPDNDIKGKGKDSNKGDKDLAGGGRDDGNDNSRGGSLLSDDDLVAVGNDESYKPDKGKGAKGGSSSNVDDVDPSDDNNYDTMAETGTIAGIVSAVGMALVAAVSSYISYQKKKLCFSIQQSLNADIVKADAPDAVVAQEPQVQQTLLQPPNAEPPTEENAV